MINEGLLWFNELEITHTLFSGNYKFERFFHIKVHK